MKNRKMIMNTKLYKTYPFLMVLFITLFFLALLNIKCSIDVAGFGSETTNGIVAGIVVDTSDDKADNTQIILISETFNPVKDGKTVSLYMDTTDSVGAYSFNIKEKGTFNVYGIDLTTQKMLIHKNIYIHKDKVSLVDTLKDPGVVRVLLPDTVDTTNGYMYIEGTCKSEDLKECTVLGGGYYSFIFDSVPAGDIPAFIYRTRELISPTITISESATVISNDTITIGISDTLKPIWRFSFVVGVPEYTSSYYGGLDSIRKLIEAQFVSGTKKFNDPNVFSGILHFSVDSIYQFNTSVNDEIKLPPQGFDYRIVYEGLSTEGVGTYSTENRTVHHAWLIDGLFGNSSLDALVWNFGMSRGCWDLDGLIVKAENNPVNHQGYDGVESIMNYPYGEDKWDEFSVNAVNYYADKVYTGPHILNSAFPASIGVVVKDENGSPVDSAEIKLYGIGWSTFTVDTPAVYTGITNSNGEYVFPVNPFEPDGVWPLNYSNFLVSAVDSGNAAYAWMPVTEVANKWFEDANGDYRIVVHF